MATLILVRFLGRQWPGISHVLKLLGLPLLLLPAGCIPGGDQGQPSAPSAPSPAVEGQAIANLLALYQGNRSGCENRAHATDCAF